MAFLGYQISNELNCMNMHVLHGVVEQPTSTWEGKGSGLQEYSDLSLYKDFERSISFSIILL